MAAVIQNSSSCSLKILALISTLLSSICRSSCLYPRNTNISSGLDLSSILLLKIRCFFYTVSLNIEWQGRLVSWLASHFTSLGSEHKTWCILPRIKIIRKILLVLSTSEKKKPPEWLSKLWLVQGNNRSSLFCGCQVKSGLPFFEGHVLTKHKSAQILMACAPRQDDLTVPFDFEGCGCVNQLLTKGLAQILRDSCQSYWWSGMIYKESTDPFMLLSQWVEAWKQKGERSHDTWSVYAQWAVCWSPKLYLFWGHYSCQQKKCLSLGQAGKSSQMFEWMNELFLKPAWNTKVFKAKWGHLKHKKMLFLREELPHQV